MSPLTETNDVAGEPHEVNQRSEGAGIKRLAPSDRSSLNVARGAYLLPVSLVNLKAQNIPPQTFAIDQLIPNAAVTLLGGHGGAGKSMLALTFAAHVACGKEWGGLRVGCGRAVYLSLEDDRDTILRRLQRIIEANELEESLVTANLSILDGASCERELVRVTGNSSHSKVKPTEVMEELKGYAAGARLVIIDNASEIHEIDENSRAEVSAFIRILSKIAREQGAAVLLLAHVDKVAARAGARGNAYSGSTAWHNAVRSRLVLVVGSNGERQLVQEKLNFGKLHGPINLEFTDQGVLVASAVQRTLVNMRTLEDRRLQERRDEDLVLRAMRATGAPVSAGRFGSGNTFASLKNFHQLGSVFLGAEGKQRFYSTIERLESDRKIQKVTFSGSNRRPRIGWVISEEGNTKGVGDAPVASLASLPPYPLHGGAPNGRTEPIAPIQASDSELVQLVQ